VQLAIGKTSFETTDLVANFAAVMDEIERARPASTKGRYIKKVTVSSTMGPGIKVDPSRLGTE
jgi:large subunit ribosomal protein L1